MLKEDTSFAILILAVIGLPFLVAGLVVIWLVPPAIAAEGVRIGSLPVSSATRLADTRLGQEVLVEGRLSLDNPVRYHTFVAYEVETLEKDSDGDDRWVRQSTVTPFLLVEVADGRIRLEEEYRLVRTGSSIREGDVRYTGLTATDPVIAVGVLTDRRDSPKIKAEFVAYGTQADYVTAQQHMATFWWWFGLLFALIGAGMLAASLVLVTRSWWRRLNVSLLFLVE